MQWRLGNRCQHESCNETRKLLRKSGFCAALKIQNSMPLTFNFSAKNNYSSNTKNFIILVINFIYVISICPVISIKLKINNLTEKHKIPYSNHIQPHFFSSFD